MKGFNDIRRHVYSFDGFKPKSYHPLQDYLDLYRSDTIPAVSQDHYSKIRAISNLSNMLCNQVSVSEYEKLLRALLTDQGLLFAQTRERFYTEASHSKANHVNEGSHSLKFARSLGNGHLNTLNLALSYAEEIYHSRESGFEELYPLISLERVRYAVRRIFENWDEPFSSFELYNEEDNDAGYCRGALSTLAPSDRAGSKGEARMEEWLNQTYMKFGDSKPINAGHYAKEDLGFSVSESFEFFANIMLKSIACDRIRIHSLTGGGNYTQALAVEQEGAFLQQVAAFQKENLSCWINAIPALHQYLHPDLSQFKTPTPLTWGVTNQVESLTAKLSDAFENYLRSAEPCSRKQQEQMRSLCAGAATFFVAAYPESGGPPLFGDKPAAVFYLFRSPVHRRMYQWPLPKNLGRIIDDACIRYPLPITQQSIAADRKLYKEIVEICDRVCTNNRQPFFRSAWDALWTCIEQTVDCLSFRMDELISVQNLFHALISPVRLQFRSNWNGFLIGYLVLDKFLEQKLYSSSPPIYISQWRLLMNKTKGTSLYISSNMLQKAICTYRKQLETSDTPNTEAIWKCLKPLCRKIDWSTISAHIVHKEEIASAANVAEAIIGEAIPDKLRQNILSIIKDDRLSGTGRDNEVKSMQAVCIEWLLLQCVCDQARRELMESVYLYLSKTAKDQA